jgi:hypothetical protein
MINWEAWAWAAWLVAFGVLETIGLVKHKDAMTLTFFIQHHFAKWILALLLGWLQFHFLIAPAAKG